MSVFRHFNRASVTFILNYTNPRIIAIRLFLFLPSLSLRLQSILPYLFEHLLFLFPDGFQVDLRVGNEDIVLELNTVIEHDLLELAPLDMIIGY
jgi:hypothetical protein